MKDAIVVVMMMMMMIMLCGHKAANACLFNNCLQMRSFDGMPTEGAACEL